MKNEMYRLTGKQKKDLTAAIECLKGPYGWEPKISWFGNTYFQIGKPQESIGINVQLNIEPKLIQQILDHNKIKVVVSKINY